MRFFCVHTSACKKSFTCVLALLVRALYNELRRVSRRDCFSGHLVFGDGLAAYFWVLRLLYTSDGGNWNRCADDLSGKIGKTLDKKRYFCYNLKGYGHSIFIWRSL